MGTRFNKIDTKKAIPLIILLALILTPIFTINEAVSFILGSVQNRADTNILIKLSKDFLFILLIMLGFFRILQNKKSSINIIFLLFFILLFGSLIISYLHSTHLIILIAGVRWTIPLLLIIVLLKYIDKRLQTKISKILIYLFFIAFIFQIIEFLYMPPLWGQNALGLSKRNPGFFAQNNTMAFFTLIVFYYSLVFKTSKKLSNITYTLVPLSIYLTSSGTGVVVLGIMYIYLIYSKIKDTFLRASFFILLSGLLGVFLYMLPILTNRGNVYQSILARVSIFFRSFNLDNLFLSSYFGLATNTGILMNHKFSLVSTEFFIADSTLTSIVANIGIIALAVFLYIIFYVRSKSLEFALFLIVFGLFSITTIIMEAYPMNLLFAINIAYFYKIKKDKEWKKYENNKLNRKLR